MFLVIIGVIIYLVYNYIEYKNSVNKIIEKQNGFNSNLNADIISVDEKYRPLINTANADIHKLDNKINSYSSKIDNTSNMIFDFDRALKNFFVFSSNNQSISGKIFDNIFAINDANYRIKMIKRVEAVSGMTIDTDVTNDFKICKSSDRTKCISMNTNEAGFNIKPAGTDTINILNKNNRPLAKFNLQNDSIHLGGYSNQTLYLGGFNGDISTHAMKIEGSNVFVYDNSFFTTSRLRPSVEAFTNYEPESYTLGQIFNELYDYTSDTKTTLEDNISDVDRNLNTLSRITSRIIENDVKVFAQFIIQNNKMNNPDTNKEAKRNYLRFKILPLVDIMTGETIIITIPKTEIGHITTSALATQAINISGIPTTNYPITSDTNNVILQITIPRSASDLIQSIFIQKHTLISVTYSGFEWITDMTETFNSGIITGFVVPQAQPTIMPSQSGTIVAQETFMNFVSNLDLDPKLTEAFISYT